MQCKDPLSGIAEALSEFLVGLLLGDDKHELQRVRHRILRVMGSDEVNILTALIPNLKKFIGEGRDISEYTPCTIQKESTVNNGWNRLKYSFLQFFQAVCTALGGEHPLITHSPTQIAHVY